MDHRDKGILEDLEKAGKVLVGIGAEWKAEREPEIFKAYEALAGLLEGKDYFVVTTNTDALIYESSLNPGRIVAPCGNETWRQCSLACTKDIWEPGEIPDDICPHCGAPLTGNTIKAQVYIEEGYLPQWERYTRWLAGTLNRETMILELGAGFGSPGIIRFPFEKTAYLNQKAFFCRVHRKFPQIIEELAGRSAGILQDSVEWMAAYCLQGICEQ